MKLFQVFGPYGIQAYLSLRRTHDSEQRDLPNIISKMMPMLEILQLGMVFMLFIVRARDKHGYLSIWFSEGQKSLVSSST